MRGGSWGKKEALLLTVCELWVMNRSGMSAAFIQGMKGPSGYHSLKDTLSSSDNRTECVEQIYRNPFTGSLQDGSITPQIYIYISKKAPIDKQSEKLNGLLLPTSDDMRGMLAANQ